jgi:predicted SAM-dependent methyltransferase
MKKINMGCGKRDFGPDWIHIDGGDYNHLNYKDITKLQFENNSIDLIYASHVIEYFDRNEIIDILLEWNRVLKQNAILRVAVPDFSTLSNLYLNQNLSLNKILGPLYGKMQMGNNTIYHKTVYDFLSLKDVLLKTGFYNITKYDWRKTEHSQFDDHSQAYIPHMDKQNGTLISLNVEALKE